MKAPTNRRGDMLRGSVTSIKFVRAAFALVEVMIIVAAIALHLAIICMVLALPIPRLKPASVLSLVKAPEPKLYGM